MQNTGKHPIFILLIVTCVTFFLACTSQSKKETLIIFHAGSLSVPFRQIKTEFERQYPTINVQLEADGSRACARKIIDLNKPCDIMASADYKVINNLLIPQFAQWNLKFANNQMVIGYTTNSKYANSITANNWPQIILKPEVSYGRSDPNSDPCGYRTSILAHLAEQYYQKYGFADSLLNKLNVHIRPKSADLVALLEMQALDYIFIYKSVAQQHNLPYLVLSDSINLKSPNLLMHYNQAKVRISGKTPNDSINHYGEPIIYGITQLKNAPNPEAAKKFLKFFFVDGIGIKIMEENGQNSVIPSLCTSYQLLPTYLKPYALESEN